jgi:hypothetical protein
MPRRIAYAALLESTTAGQAMMTINSGIIKPGSIDELIESYYPRHWRRARRRRSTFLRLLAACGVAALLTMIWVIASGICLSGTSAG